MYTFFSKCIHFLGVTFDSTSFKDHIKNVRGPSMYFYCNKNHVHFPFLGLPPIFSFNNISTHYSLSCPFTPKFSLCWPTQSFKQSINLRLYSSMQSKRLPPSNSLHHILFTTLTSSLHGQNKFCFTSFFILFIPIAHSKSPFYSSHFRNIIVTTWVACFHRVRLALTFLYTIF